ncbi:MAG: hypothetical protein QXI12_07335 [Candidatus Methanomethyliaceae archaeon]
MDEARPVHLMVLESYIPVKKGLFFDNETSAIGTKANPIYGVP